MDVKYGDSRSKETLPPPLDDRPPKMMWEVREGGICQKKSQNQFQEEDNDLNVDNFECEDLCDV